MPRAKRAQPRSNLSFVISNDGKANKAQVHAHAAYWSHVSRRGPSRNGKLDGASADVEETIQQQREDENSYSTAVAVSNFGPPPSPQNLYAPYDFFLGTGFDVFRTLPQLPMEMRNPEMLYFQKMFMFKVFGEDFICNEILRTTTSTHTVFAACLLLSTAYYIAKSGNSHEAHFTQLKGEVLRRVQSEISDFGVPSSLEVAHAISTLGSPIVSLVNNQALCSLQAKQDLGYGWASKIGNARLVEEEAHADAMVHQKAANTVLSQWQGADDPHYHSLRWQLVTYRAMSHAMYVLTLPYASPGDIFGRGSNYYSKTNNSDYEFSDWFSPLTRSVHVAHPGRPAEDIFEKYTFSLIEIAQKWLETFHQNGIEDESTTTLRMQQRRDLRKTLSSFPKFSIEGVTTTVCIYRACQLTINVMLRADENETSVSVAGSEMNYAPEVIRVIRKTTIGRLWGHRSGILYWVASVLHMAPTSDCLRVTSTMLLTHFTQTFATSEEIRSRGLDFALEPLRTLITFDQICRKKSSGP